MVLAGRKVFEDGSAVVRILFKDAPDLQRNNGAYIATDGFRFPASMVKKVFAPGGLILTPDCTVMEHTVLNERNQVCIMIRAGNAGGGAATEVLIPYRIVEKIIGPLREAYPQDWK